jgi:hypothetical protein
VQQKSKEKSKGERRKKKKVLKWPKTISKIKSKISQRNKKIF